MTADTKEINPSKLPYVNASESVSDSLSEEKACYNFTRYTMFRYKSVYLIDDIAEDYLLEKFLQTASRKLRRPRRKCFHRHGGTQSTKAL